MLETIETRREALRHREGGFTLVELLVVIAVLAILTAVAVFAVGGITDKGKKSACEATSDAVRVASEAHAAQDPGGAYAATISELVTEEFLRLDEEATIGGGGLTITVQGGTVTYNATTGAVTDNCAA